MWPLVFCIIFCTLSDVVLPVTLGYDRKDDRMQRLTALGRGAYLNGESKSHASTCEGDILTVMEVSLSKGGAFT